MEENTLPKVGAERVNSLKKAAIFNFIGAGLCLLFAVLVFLLCTGVLGGELENEENDAGKALGFVFVFILLMPLALITLVPAGAIGAIYQTARAAIYLRQIKSGAVSKKGVVIFSLILKIIMTLLVGYCLVLFTSLFIEFNKIAVFAILAVGAATAVIHFLAVKYEFASLKA